MIKVSLVVCEQLPCELLSCHSSGRVIALAQTNGQVGLHLMQDADCVTIKQLPQSPLIKHTYAVNWLV